MPRKLKKYDIYKKFYYEHLKNILRNLRKWNGLPDSIFEPTFNDQILFEGYSVMYEYNGEIITGTGSLSGLDMYMMPTEFTSSSSNPYVIPAQVRKIGKDCVVFRNTPDYRSPRGFANVLDLYSSRLADLAISIDQSVRNSRVCIIPLVEDDKEAIRIAETLKQMYDGEPLALAYKTGFNTNDNILFPVKSRDNLVVAELQDAYHTILDDFYQRIGIQNLSVDKKERTNLEEMGSNDQKLFLNERVIMEPIERACEEANKMFGINISCEINRPKEETDGENTRQTGVDNDSEPRADVRE